MPLFGVVAGAQPGAQGFDAAAVLNSHAAATFRQAGFAFCIRYLSRALGQQHGDLTTAEADLILDAGLDEDHRWCFTTGENRPFNNLRRRRWGGDAFDFARELGDRAAEFRSRDHLS